MNGKALGHVLDCSEHSVEFVFGDASIDMRKNAAEDTLGGMLEGRRCIVRAGLIERHLQLCLEIVERGLGFFKRDVAATHKCFGVQLAYRTGFVDALVHKRLRVARVVAFVVAMAAVTHHVDDDITIERSAVVERKPSDANDGFGVVTVHVKDRGLDHLGDIG
ncbi:unannotated protein [freshwater metagenome]|uniref:Unannotated protein n=1 Tax=freshwater metagenome TaxID=449393 RepID=A0A6J6E2S7_9ZZZZ